MKFNFYQLIMTLCCLGLASLSTAQDRYFDEIFDATSISVDETYGTNISVLTGVPEAIPLLMDVYTPVGDDATDRPLILVPHTGSFLPQIFSRQITGAKNDSVVVEICKRLARRGYVAAAITYRLGWIPESEDQNVRTGTLLQAAYRAIQDTRTCVRYFRKTAAEDGNPYGIDPDKVGVWGVGTGGYLAMGTATLNEYEEVTIDKFLDGNTLLPLADTVLLGNFWGTTNAPLCIANYPEYNSDIQLSVNMGGALGDSTWIDGPSLNEPPMIGFHVLKDPFAPYHDGAVIVPTTLQFVVNVSGTRSAVERANNLGMNDILEGIPLDKDPIQPIVEFMKTIDVTLPTGVTIPLGEDNMYPFITEGLESGPWDWWDYNTMAFIVSQVNLAFGTDFNPDTLHAIGLLTNPTMSAERGRTYLDTIFSFAIPRACKALDLGCGLISDIEEINPAEIQFSLSPNPASDRIDISTIEDHLLQSVSMFDLQGRLVLKRISIGQHKYSFEVGHLSSGMYVLRAQYKDGFISKKLVIENRN